MPREVSELVHRLARDAEAVCRHYLSNGRRQGNYWLVGDVRNAPGRSTFVRLGERPAGKWTAALSVWVSATAQACFAEPVWHINGPYRTKWILYDPFLLTNKWNEL